MRKTLLSVCFIIQSIAFAQVPTNGLVAYYPFSGNTNDVSGNAVNGTSNSLTYTADRFGTATSSGSFNGTSSYMSIIHNSAYINLEETFSVSLWYKAFPGFYTRSGLFYSRMDINGDEQGGLGWDYSPGSTSSAIDSTVSSYIAGSTSHSLQSVSLNTNQWHNVIIVYEKNSKGKLYVDGVFAVETGTYSTFFEASSPIRIGAVLGVSGWGGYFKGAIDDIRVYNRVLTANEASNLYHENGYATSVFSKTETSKFLFYPNPATDVLTISSLSDQSYEVNVRVLNTLGEVQLTQSFKGADAHEFNTSSLTSGIYLVQLSDAENKLIETKKLII